MAISGTTSSGKSPTLSSYSGNCLRHSPMSSIHACVSGCASIFSSSRVKLVTTRLTSPTMGTCASRTLSISTGSMSMWITFASGAKELMSPVTRSEKRAPHAIIKSDLSSAQLAYREPCIPASPKFRGSLDGTAPLAMSVVTTGMRIDRASSVTSADAPDDTTPPPT